MSFFRATELLAPPEFSFELGDDGLPKAPEPQIVPTAQRQRRRRRAHKDEPLPPAPRPRGDNWCAERLGLLLLAAALASAVLNSAAELPPDDGPGAHRHIKFRTEDTAYNANLTGAMQYPGITPQTLTNTYATIRVHINEDGEAAVGFDTLSSDGGGCKSSIERGSKALVDIGLAFRFPRFRLEDRPPQIIGRRIYQPHDRRTVYALLEQPIYEMQRDAALEHAREKALAARGASASSSPPPAAAPRATRVSTPPRSPSSPPPSQVGSDDGTGWPPPPPSAAAPEESIAAAWASALEEPLDTLAAASGKRLLPEGLRATARTLRKSLPMVLLAIAQVTATALEHQVDPSKPRCDPERIATLLRTYLQKITAAEVEAAGGDAPLAEEEDDVDGDDQDEEDDELSADEKARRAEEAALEAQRADDERDAQARAESERVRKLLAAEDARRRAGQARPAAAAAPTPHEAEAQRQAELAAVRAARAQVNALTDDATAPNPRSAPRVRDLSPEVRDMIAPSPPLEPEAHSADSATSADVNDEEHDELRLAREELLRKAAPKPVGDRAPAAGSTADPDLPPGEHRAGSAPRGPPRGPP